MSKREGYNLLFIFIIIAYFGGLNYAVDMFCQVIKNVNSILVKLGQDSVLTILFKYFITFPIVGFILVKIGSPKGKEGHFIGKILYFIIGYVICTVLDWLSKIIF